MKLKQKQITEVLKNTHRTKDAMSNLAKDLSELNLKQYRSLANEFADSYEGPALGNLLTVSAINRVKLCTGLLIKSMTVVDELKPIYYCFSLHDEEPIEALTSFAFDNHRESPQFAAVAAEICMELSIRYQANNSLIVKLKDLIVNGDSTGYIKERLSSFQNDPATFNICLDPLKDLPELATQMSHPLPDYREEAPWKIGKVDPGNLDQATLVQYYYKAKNLRYHNKAFEFFAEMCKRFSGEYLIHLGRRLYIDAYYFADVDLFKKLDKLLSGKYAGVNISPENYLADSRDGFTLLENIAFEMLKDPANYDAKDFFQSASTFFEKHYPNLDVIFKRAAIATYPVDTDATGDAMRRIRFTRTTLGLDPKNDPVEKVYHWIKDGKGNNNDEVKHLQNRLIKRDKTIENLNMEVHELKEKTIGDQDYLQLKKENHELTLEIAKQKMKLKNWKLMIAEEKEKNGILQKQLNTLALN